MACLAYLGQPRSGKSYSAVEYQVIPALQRGRHVVTNIPLKADYLISVYGGEITQLTTADILHPDFPSTVPNGVVLIVDEIWRRWPSGQKVNRVPLADLELLKEHGHKVDSKGNTMQVVLVTQDASDLAYWVRKLVKFSFVHEKLDAVGMANKFSIRVFKGCEPKPLARDQVREAVGSYKEEVYQFYTSATQSESSDLNVGDEIVMDKRTSVWGSWQIKALLLFIPLCLLCGGYLFWYWLGMADRQAAKQAAVTGRPVSSAPSAGRLQAPELAPVQQVIAQADQGTPAAVVPAAAPLQAPPTLSQQWRVVGFVQRGEPGGSKVAWQSMTGYGYAPVVESQDNWLQDLVVIQGLGVVRKIPVTDCTRYPNSRDYFCDIDGERVTPWSGQMGYSAEVVGQGSVTGVKEAAPKAVEKTI